MRPTDWVNTRPRLGELLGGDSGTGEGQEPGPSCCDPDPDLPDRGSGDGGAIASALSEGTLAYVQGKATNNANTDATIAITFDDPATGGNLLIALYSARTGSTSSGAVTPSGWTRYANDFSGPSFDGGASTIFYKIAAGGETTITITKGGSDYASLEVSEYSGNLSFDTADDADSVAASTSLATDAITPAGTNVLLYAAFNQSARTATYTWGSSFTELSDVNVYTSGPSSTSGYRIVTGASGSYSATATSSESDGYGWAILAFTASGSAWSVRADPVNDGNDATYQTVTGTDLIRLDLGAAHRIVSTRIRIAANTAGARTFTVKAANLVDFSDEVTLGTIAFTATGSYTAQDVTGSWTNTTAYRYYELSIGTSDTYRIHAWELYEGTLATDLTDHVDATTGAHDASAVDYDNSGSGLSAENAQDALDELAGLSGGSPFAALGWFNVEDYGAVHDGVTDDTPSIQDAIDACFAAGGGTIYFPAGIYQLDGALQDTGTYNSQLKIPQRDLVRADGAIAYRFLGASPGYTNWEGTTASSVLRSSWNGTISGNPAIISGGLHDSLTINWSVLYFENIEIRAHSDPKLSGIDATKCGGVRFQNLVLSTYHADVFDIPLPASWTDVPSNTNAIGVDFPRGYDDLYSGGDGLNVQGFYTGFRPGEQFTALGVTVGWCARGVDFRGEVDTGGLKRHMAYIGRLETFFCPRGMVFSGDESWVNIGVYGAEDDADVDASWAKVYDIDDANNYGRGFIGWHTTDWTDGPDDNLVVNGGSGLSLYGAFAKRWKLSSVVDIPTGTDPSTNPSNGFRLYAASATGKPTTRSSSGTVTTIMREGDTAGGDLSGTYPNPSVADDSHSHTSATAPGGAGHGAILLESGHAVPFTFDEIIQASDGSDFLYASA